MPTGSNSTLERLHRASMMRSYLMQTFRPPFTINLQDTFGTGNIRSYQRILPKGSHSAIFHLHLIVAPSTAVLVPPPCWVNRGLIVTFWGRSANRLSVLRCAHTSASPG